MTARDPLWLGTGYSYSPEEDRLLLSNLLRAPRATFTPSTTLGNRPGNGIIREGDLVVTQDGTPGMRVLVAAGSAFIAGSQSAEQGVYAVRNDGNVVVNLAAADAVNRRNDIIVARIQDADYSGASRTFTLEVVQGTNYAGAHNNANDPVLPANSIPLARIQVAAGVTSILNASITDLRQFVPQAGRRRGTAAARALAINVEAGEEWFETDTARVYRYTGTAWTYVSGGTPPSYFFATNTVNQNLSGTAWTLLNMPSEQADYGSNYNAGTSTYVVPETGVYVIRAYARVSLANASQSAILGAWKNGVDMWELHGTETTNRNLISGDTWGFVLSIEWPLTAGDQMTLRFYNGQANVCLALGGYCNWSIRKV
jgi:hypothetical protein